MHCTRLLHIRQRRGRILRRRDDRQHKLDAYGIVQRINFNSRLQAQSRVFYVIIVFVAKLRRRRTKTTALFFCLVPQVVAVGVHYGVGKFFAKPGVVLGQRAQQLLHVLALSVFVGRSGVVYHWQDARVSYYVAFLDVNHGRISVMPVRDM